MRAGPVPAPKGCWPTWLSDPCGQRRRRTLLSAAAAANEPRLREQAAAFVPDTRGPRRAQRRHSARLRLRLRLGDALAQELNARLYAFTRAPAPHSRKQIVEQRRRRARAARALTLNIHSPTRKGPGAKHLGKGKAGRGALWRTGGAEAARTASPPPPPQD
uniref:uncharacterized protein LOC118155380 n=1 Tax=Callithrix jacchus TaxID=9483 RepID=UPI0023DD1B02|nr:uncharacterized protein LOC118155380 [Callithrix jacchus]